MPYLPLSPLPLNEALRHAGGAEERRPRLQHERYRDRRHQLRESSLVAERGDERPVGELRADLRGDPPADEDTPHRQRLEGEVARLGAVDRDEEVERLDAERVAARQADLGHDRARVAGRDPVVEPRGLWHTTGIAEKPIDVVETGSSRKSTRLNSSHSQISYAVFCLKKKK